MLIIDKDTGESVAEFIGTGERHLPRVGEFLRFRHEKDGKIVRNELYEVVEVTHLALTTENKSYSVYSHSPMAKVKKCYLEPEINHDCKGPNGNEG